MSSVVTRWGRRGLSQVTSLGRVSPRTLMNRYRRSRVAPDLAHGSGRPRALILTAKTGGGHLSLADSIRDQIAEEYECAIVDPQPPIMHQHYRAVSRYALWMWAAEYRISNTPERALQALKFYARLMAPRLKLLLDRTHPDLVISTYPLVNYGVARLLERRYPHIPFVLLFTDPKDLHAAWMVEQGADLTFAPTRETYAQALAAGFPPDRLKLVGWPVRGQFYRAGGQDRAAFLRKLGLNPSKFTVFLQGGGEGAAQFGHTVKRVLDAHPSVQIILACGTNEVLRIRYAHTPRVRTLPFTKEIGQYMAAADVVMGKAGPNMLFETVTLGKPFIATTFIPGQEECNLQMIERYDLGWVALEPEEQGAIIYTLATTPSALARTAASVEAYRAWNTGANKTILPLALQLAPGVVKRETARQG